MANKWPIGWHGRTHHPAQSGMGVDETLAALTNGKMILAGPDAKQHDIPRRSLPLVRREAKLGGPSGIMRDGPHPQPISAGQGKLASGCDQTGLKHTDAIKPGCRIAAVQAKPCANQCSCGPRQIQSRFGITHCPSP